MTTHDMPAVCAIEQAAHTYPWNETQLRGCLRPEYHNTVLLIDDIIVGFSIIKRVLDEAELCNIAILPTYQGQGLARKLLRRQIGNLPIQQLYLEVRASNVAALRLYQGLGFSKIGERKDYYPHEGGREDAHCMRLLVDHSNDTRRS